MIAHRRVPIAEVILSTTCSILCKILGPRISSLVSVYHQTQNAKCSCNAGCVVPVQHVLSAGIVQFYQSTFGAQSFVCVIYVCD